MMTKFQNKKSKKKTHISSIAFFLIPAAVSLIFLPNNYDVFNLPKLVALVIASLSFALLSKQRQKITLPHIALLAIICLPMLQSNDLVTAVIGNYQQNTGILTLLACYILILRTMGAQEIDVFQLFCKSFGVTGVLVSLYALIQFFNLDPISWATPGWIVSTLGNPNFTSSFISLAAIIIWIDLMDSQKRIEQRLLSLPIFLLHLYTLYICSAFQGILILVFTIASSTILKLQKKFKNIQIYIVFVTTAIIATLIMFWSFLSTELDESLKYRIFYWRTGVVIFAKNSLLGTGYGDFQDDFFKYRNENQYLQGGGEFAASAHNYFIEFFALGGLLLGGVYCFIIFRTTLALAKIIKSKDQYSSKRKNILFYLWLGYNLQSLVSVPTITFLTLGSLISGIILNVERSIENTRKIASQKPNLVPNILMPQKLVNFFLVSLIVVFLLVGGKLLIDDLRAKKIFDFKPQTVYELDVKMNEITNHSISSWNKNEYEYQFAKNLFNQGLGQYGIKLMEKTLDSPLYAYNKNWYIGQWYLQNRDCRKALNFLEMSLKLDPANLALREDLETCSEVVYK